MEEICFQARFDRFQNEVDIAFTFFTRLAASFGSSVIASGSSTR